MKIKQMIATSNEQGDFIYGLSESDTLYLWTRSGWELCGSTFDDSVEKEED